MTTAIKNPEFVKMFAEQVAKASELVWKMTLDISKGADVDTVIETAKSFCEAERLAREYWCVATCNCGVKYSWYDRYANENEMVYQKRLRVNEDNRVYREVLRVATRIYGEELPWGDLTR